MKAADCERVITYSWKEGPDDADLWVVINNISCYNRKSGTRRHLEEYKIIFNNLGRRSNKFKSMILIA